jgi:hypothetical protein
MAALLLIAAACTGGQSSPTGEAAAIPDARSDESEAGPDGSSLPTVPATVPDEPTPLRHDHHQVAFAGSPSGPAPSFNESAGCGEDLQGFRGPQADSPGRVSDSQVIGGPWGDFFGRTMGEVRDRLVPMALPNAPGLSPVTIYVHERVVPALEQVIENLAREQEAGNYYRLHHGYVFSWSPFTVPPHAYLSFHAAGAAIDINSHLNPYRDDNEFISDMPGWFVAAWTSAGWCWGGDWRRIKDPMHFSWKGPIHTPGYDIPDRYAPLTPIGDFTHSLSFDTALGELPEGAVRMVADTERDGAPDAVEIGPFRGTRYLGVLTARALHRYETCRWLGPTPHRISTDSRLLLADGSGDGRADLWEISPTGGSTYVTVYTLDSRFTQHQPIVEIGRNMPADAVFLAGDHDQDGVGDLYVIEPGDPTTMTLYRGPDFSERLHSGALPLTTTGDWQFALGSRDLDRIPDLFARHGRVSGTISILTGDLGFAGPPERLDTALVGDAGEMSTGDFDGDGWDDIYLLDESGSLTVFLGGDRSGVPDETLTRWFLDEEPWNPLGGCAPEGQTPR